ncbi:MAG: hypothetical protein QM726_01045 [Chitinophagaceae bacterium]
MGIIIILVLAFLIWIGIRIYKSAKSSNLTFDDHHFKQGNVEVIFSAGTIKINNYTYNVNQVTRISSEPYTTNSHGNSRAYKAIIEVDDFKKPRHQMEFFSRKKAEEFTQRLCTAIRKAGGPSFT